jgi:hypothetical protein
MDNFGEVPPSENHLKYILADGIFQVRIKGRGAGKTMAPGPQRILNNSRPLVDSTFFSFF